MQQRVFVSKYSFRAPNMQSRDDIVTAIIDTSRQKIENDELQNTSNRSEYAGLNLDIESRNYPRKSDIKIMRQDVIAATMCINEIIEDTGLSKEILSDIPLFISNGCCHEKLPNQNYIINKVANVVLNAGSEKEKFEKIFQIIPPLLSLQTLTNSTEHFVSQYSGIAGNNTTFGNTSLSAFHAIKECIYLMEQGKNEIAIAGSSNCAGIYSNLMYRNFTNDKNNLYESPCSVFLLLETEESLKKNNRIPLIEINQLRYYPVIPRLNGTPERNPYESLETKKSNILGIFSGGLSTEDFEAEKNAAGLIWNKSFSWYTILGNMGASSIFMNILAAIIISENENYEFIECVDRDPYSRESLIELRKINNMHFTNA